MKKSPLRKVSVKKQIRNNLKYDPISGNIYWKRSYPNIRKNNVAGCINKHRNAIVIRLNDKLYFAHRIAWFLYYGKFPKDQLDHINHDGTDNRISNLREATTKQNHQNRKNAKGYYFDKGHQKWRAEIKINYKRIYIGLYNTEEEAKQARKEYEEKIGWNKF